MQGFLDLPGEIRNRIYRDYFQDTYRCEYMEESRNAPKTIKLVSNARLRRPNQWCAQPSPIAKTEILLILRFPRRCGTYNGQRTSEGWLDPHGALVLVCKQVHKEALPLLYQQIVFVFNTPRRITGFLRTVPKQNHHHVTKLHLYYTTYGHPYAASDVVWQDKHIESWVRACKSTSKSFKCLRELEIEICVNEDAPKFNLRQKWLQPLLQFRRLTCDSQKGPSGSALFDKKPRTLEKVFVKVRTRLWAHNFEGNVPLSKACKHLHRLFGQSISLAILGAKEEEAMAKFNVAWFDRYNIWQHHLGFAKTGW